MDKGIKGNTDKRLTYLDLLRSDGSIVINKKLAKLIGLNEAIIYGELVSRYCYFEDKNQLTEDGYFFNTIESLQEATSLNEYSQRKAIRALIEYGLIFQEVRGVPAKRYFKINFTNQFFNIYGTIPLKSEELDVQNLKGNNIIPNNANKSVNKKEESPEKIADFDVFWNSYPRKVEKAKSRKIWEKIKPDDDLLKKMLGSLEVAKESIEWTKDNGQFIPYPTTWLNGERWEDEYTSKENITDFGYKKRTGIAEKLEFRDEW